MPSVLNTKTAKAIVFKLVRVLIIAFIIILGTVSYNVIFHESFIKEVKANPDWYDIEWQYRKQITINSSYVDADLTDYPVLVYLASDIDLSSHAKSDGSDILFTLDDGTTKLSHEIEYYNGSTGELWAWVKIPSLSSTTDTTIYMYYGNSDAENQEDAENVWDDNYVAVYHCNDKKYTDMPEPRYGVGREQSIINGKIYVSHGMESGGPFYADCYEYDIATDTWTQKATASYPRDGVGYAVYDNKLYVFGGRNSTASDRKGLDVVECYDPSTDTWTTKASIPYATADPGVAIYNDSGTWKIFVIGGYDDSGSQNPMAKCQLYYPETDTWETTNPPSDMTYARAAPAVVQYGGYIYVYGGAGNNAKVERYDIANDTWTTLNDLPADLQSDWGLHAILDTDNLKIHLINGDNGKHYIHNIIQGSDTYTQKASQPTPRRWTNCNYYNGKIYSIAGGTSSSGTVYKIVEVYDVASDTWYPLLHDSTSNHFHAKPSGTPQYFQTGKVGKAVNLNGGYFVEDGSGIASAIASTGNFTLEAWVKFDSYSSSNEYYFIALWNTDPDQQAEIRHDDPGDFEAYLQQDDGTEVGSSSSWSVTTGTWYYLSATADGSYIRKFMDGALSGSAVSYDGTVESTTHSYYFGERESGAGNHQFFGYLDEIRISKTARSSGWISTTYNFLNDPATCISVGSEEGINNPPTISNEYPTNGSTNVDLQPTCHIDVTDADGDTMTIYWYENSTGSWVLRQTNSSVGNGTYYWQFTQANQQGTTYWWKVAVDDGTNNVTAIYHFTTKTYTWNIIESWNGNLQNTSSWHAIESWTGTVSNIASWNPIESWNGQLNNYSNWLTIEEWINNNIYNASSWNTVQIWTGSVSNSSRWKKIEEWIGELNNVSSWHTIVSWVGSLINSSKWNDIESWDGSISNTSSWHTIEQWQGSLSNISSWQSIESWQGNIYNTSAWQTIEEFSGEILNVSSWKTIEDWSGSIINTSGWNTIEEWQGSLSNVSAWHDIEEWDGSLINSSNWNIIEAWSGTVYNSTGWHIIESWQGSIYNTSNWISIELWNGNIYNISVWNSIESWEGFLYNTSAWLSIESWSGNLYNSTQWHLIEEWSGIICNATLWTSIEVWEGNLYNTSSWQNVETWNGNIYNTSAWHSLQIFDGGLFNSSLWHSIEIWSGTLINSTQWSTIEVWSGSLSNASQWNTIESFSGSVCNISAWHSIETWNGSILSTSGWQTIEAWSGSLANYSMWHSIEIISGNIFNSSNWNSIEVWNGTIVSIQAWHSIELWNGSVYNTTFWHSIEAWQGTLSNVSSWHSYEVWNGSISASVEWFNIEVWSGYIHNQTVPAGAINFEITIGEHEYKLGDSVLCIATLSDANGTAITNASVFYKIYNEDMTLLVSSVFTNNHDGSYYFKYKPPAVGNYMIYAYAYNLFRVEVFHVSENYSDILENINNSIPNATITANFEYYILVNFKVQFVDTSVASSQIINWTWSIDNKTYYEQHPKVSFDRRKTFNATLTVKDVYNNTDSITKTVRVYKKSFTPYQFVIIVVIIALISFLISIFIYREEERDEMKRRKFLNKAILFATISTIAWMISAVISISIGVPYEVIYKGVIIADWNVVTTLSIPMFFFGVGLLSAVWLSYLAMQVLSYMFSRNQNDWFSQWRRRFR